MRFLLQCLISKTFLVHLRYRFRFSFISAYLMMYTSNIPKYSELSCKSSNAFLVWYLLSFWIFLTSFSHQNKLIAIYSKSPQVSRTLLSILANLNNAVGSFDGLSSSSDFQLFQFPYHAFETILIASVITSIPVFHSFLNSLERFKYLSLFLFSLIFTLWSAGMAKITIQLVYFFLLITINNNNL